MLLRSDAWRTLLLDLVGWVNSGSWLRDTEPGRAASRDGPAHRFATRELDRRRRLVKKRGRKLARLTPAKRHRVRIATKKLRYGTEFFAGLYPGKKTAKRHAIFAEALSDLQDLMGALNDVAMGHETVRELVEGDVRDSITAAAGAAVTDVEARTRKLLVEAAEMHEGFVDAKPFWR